MDKDIKGNTGAYGEVGKGTSSKEGTNQKIGKKYMTIRDIPAAMDKAGWDVAANLMIEWFNGAAHTIDKALKGDDRCFTDAELMGSCPYLKENIVTIDWVLSFFADEKDEDNNDIPAQLQNRLYTQSAQKQLKKKLRQAGWPIELPDFRTAFRGDTKASALDRLAQVNYYFVKGGLNKMHFWAAIGNGVIKVAPAGYIPARNFSSIPNYEQFYFDYFGIYLHDSYDFGHDDDPQDQPLGVWCRQGIADLSAMQIMGVDFYNKDETYVGAYNSVFRKWRKEKGKGGDFIIFSNIRWYKNSEPTKYISIQLARRDKEILGLHYCSRSIKTAYDIMGSKNSQEGKGLLALLNDPLKKETLLSLNSLEIDNESYSFYRHKNRVKPELETILRRYLDPSHVDSKKSLAAQYIRLGLSYLSV